MSEEAEAKEYFARRQRSLRRWAIVGLVIVAIGVGIGVVIATCFETNLVPAGNKRAIEAVEAAGYHDVLIGGPDALACSEGESSRHFAATTADGRRVEGTVCCGLTGVGKGCTLRYGRSH